MTTSLNTDHTELTDLDQRILNAYAEASREGKRVPGRRALAAQLGAGEWEVRAALERLSTPLERPSRAVPLLPVPNEPGEREDTREEPPPGPASRRAQRETDPQPPAPGRDTAPSQPASREAFQEPGRETRRAATWHLTLPLYVLATAAAITIWGGWVELGALTGFGPITPLPGIADGFHINTAVVLPAGVEFYAGFALSIWQGAARCGPATRAFARWSTLGALAAGMGAQIAVHVMRANQVAVAPLGVTVAVSCVPVATLGLAMALRAMVSRDAHTPAPASGA